MVSICACNGPGAYVWPNFGCFQASRFCSLALVIVKWLQNCGLFSPTSASGLDVQVGPSVEEALCKGKSAPNLSGLAATGVLWPRLQAAVKRIEEALPLAGAPEAEAEQRRRLDALRLELPDGNSVGCSYWQCVDVPAASVAYVLGVHLMSVTYVERRGYVQ